MLPKTFNLLYHLTPTSNYKWNIDTLLQRWDVFTGKKIIAIATHETFDAPEIVKNLFPKDLNLEFIEIKNHPILRETHSLASLLLRASEFDRKGNVMFFHSKGVTRKEDPSVMAWTEAIMHYGFDNIKEVDKLLLKFPVVGCCKRYGTFAHFPKRSVYHFSGTMWAARLQDLFARNWMHVNQSTYGAEAYISLLFTAAEVGCIWGDKFQNGYDWKYMKTMISNDPYFKDFLNLHKAYIPPEKKSKVLVTNSHRVVSRSK